MALLFCDGFDDGLFTKKWSVISATVVAAAGRNGTSGVFFDASGDSLRRAIPPTSTVFLGLAFKKLTFGTTIGIASLWSDLGANIQLCLSIEANGVVAVRRGDRNDPVIISSPTPLVPNVWYYLELKATLNDAGGTLELRIDGKSVQTYTGDTRKTGSATTFDMIAIEPQSSSSDQWVDDVYICDATGSINNNFLGDIKIETLYPNADGTNSQLMGSDGNQVNNYLLVDEAGAPVTTDYVSSAVVGEKDTYNFTNLATTTGPVMGVQISNYAIKTDAGSRSIKALTISSGNTATGTSIPLQTTYNAQLQVQETNPNGGGAWTIATVNAAEFGVEVDA